LSRFVGGGLSCVMGTSGRAVVARFAMVEVCDIVVRLRAMFLVICRLAGCLMFCRFKTKIRVLFNLCVNVGG
jgi:hypothetical protein